METFTGAKVWPLDIRPGDVNATDVAHALGMTCRYGGHTRIFYSVAEHCCRLSDYARIRLRDRKLALDLLVHDAAEAYLGDIPRPLKRSMPPVWKEVESAADRACAELLGARYPFLPKVKELDNRILVDERAALMSLNGNHWTSIERVEPLGVPILGWGPKTASRQWLQRHQSLRPDRSP